MDRLLVILNGYIYANINMSWDYFKIENVSLQATTTYFLRRLALW